MNDKSIYNEEPVFYCSRCLSLAVRSMEDFCYCGKCGSTDIKETSIEDWEKLHRERYGYRYLDKKPKIFRKYGRD